MLPFLISIFIVLHLAFFLFTFIRNSKAIDIEICVVGFFLFHYFRITATDVISWLITHKQEFTFLWRLSSWYILTDLRMSEYKTSAPACASNSTCSKNPSLLDHISFWYWSSSFCGFLHPFTYFPLLSMAKTQPELLFLLSLNGNLIFDSRRLFWLIYS